MDYPIVTNLRCGDWYVEHPDDQCYFKSADGHYGRWGFYISRLNLNVIDHVAASGGVVIVDSTRKGKKFPDSFNRTIPIWIHVVNSCIADIKREKGIDVDDWYKFFMPAWVYHILLFNTRSLIQKKYKLKPYYLHLKKSSGHINQY